MLSHFRNCNDKEWSAIIKMVHEYFHPEDVKWEDFFQEGGHYFEGIPYQRGFGNKQYNVIQRGVGIGIGSVFKTLLRYFMPKLKKAGTAVAKEGLDTGARILSDIAHGTNVKEAVINEAKQGLTNLSQKIQKGSGKRRRRRKSSFSHRKNSNGRRSVSHSAKKKKLDTLGFY